MSKLNKRLALLKQQHQQLKLRLQFAKEEAAQKQAAQMLADQFDASPMMATTPQNFLKKRGVFSSRYARQLLLAPF